MTGMVDWRPLRRLLDRPWFGLGRVSDRTCMVFAATYFLAGIAANAISVFAVRSGNAAEASVTHAFAVFLVVLAFLPWLELSRRIVVKRRAKGGLTASSWFGYGSLTGKRCLNFTISFWSLGTLLAIASEYIRLKGYSSGADVVLGSGLAMYLMAVSFAVELSRRGFVLRRRRAEAIADGEVTS